jgi:hypothetical protein
MSWRRGERRRQHRQEQPLQALNLLRVPLTPFLPCRQLPLFREGRRSGAPEMCHQEERPGRGGERHSWKRDKVAEAEQGHRSGQTLEPADEERTHALGGLTVDQERVVQGCNWPQGWVGTMSLSCQVLAK